MVLARARNNDTVSSDDINKMLDKKRKRFKSQKLQELEFLEKNECIVTSDSDVTMLEEPPALSQLGKLKDDQCVQFYFLIQKLICCSISKYFSLFRLGWPGTKLQ